MLTGTLLLAFIVHNRLDCAVLYHSMHLTDPALTAVAS